MRRKAIKVGESEDVRMSERALQVVSVQWLAGALARHYSGDYGEVDEGLRARNDEAREAGGVIVSVHRTESGRIFTISSDFHPCAGPRRTWVCVEGEPPPRWSALRPVFE